MKKIYINIGIAALSAILLAWLSISLYHFVTDYFGLSESMREKDEFIDAEIFIKNGFPEIKDLAGRLLTILSSLLVFSVTFSEKIVNFQSTNLIAKWWMFSCWILLLFAIIAAGFGIAFNAFTMAFALSDVAATSVSNKQSITFYEPASKTLYLITLSGLLFVASLLAMIVAAFTAHRK